LFADESFVGSYPWIDCSHTVDTLLRERCETHEALEQAYHVRYAFNIARSDYRAAGGAMMTYWFNLIKAKLEGSGVGGDMMREGEVLVELKVLQEQAHACLAAINCYSLIDPRHAYWVPERSEPLRPVERGAVSGGKRDHGGHVKTELDAYAAPEAITLPMLLQHYALLRARIRLAEAAEATGRLRAGRATGHPLVPYAVQKQQRMAEDTVAELLRVGMIDDAISLGAAFCTSSSSCKPPPPTSSGLASEAPTDDLSLATEDLCRRVTQRCLQAFAAPGALLRDEDGAEVEATDAWEFLRRFLQHFDGAAQPPALVQKLPHCERDSALAVELPRPFGGLARVAAETFMRCSPDADANLPPWLVHVMCVGTEGRAGTGFDGRGGDTCGLLRLLLRHQRLEEAAQLVVHCLTLERDGVPVVPRASGRVNTIPTLEECLIMDLSAPRYVPYNLIDQLLGRLDDDKHSMCRSSVDLALQDWVRFTKMESQMIYDFTKAEVRGSVDKVLHERGIDPATGEKDPRMAGGEIDVALLVDAIVSRVQGTTPIGKSFERLETAQGQRVGKSDR
jgi:hypothetical protein